MLTGEDLYKFKSKHDERSGKIGVLYSKRHLPEYALNEENGQLKETWHYLQFIGLHPEEGTKDKKYYLLDIHFAEGVLAMEMDNIGNTEALESIDFSFLKKLKLESFEDLGKMEPKTINLVIDVKYYRVGFEYVETDVEMNLVGMLDDNKQLIAI